MCTVLRRARRWRCQRRRRRRRTAAHFGVLLGLFLPSCLPFFVFLEDLSYSFFCWMNFFYFTKFFSKWNSRSFAGHHSALRLHCCPPHVAPQPWRPPIMLCRPAATPPLPPHPSLPSFSTLPPPTPLFPLPNLNLISVSWSQHPNSNPRLQSCESLHRPPSPALRNPPGHPPPKTTFYSLFCSHRDSCAPIGVTAASTF